MPFKFPFTNYHELNLDWIIKKIEEITKIFEESSETITIYEDRLADAEQDAADALAAAGSAVNTATQADTAASAASAAASAASAAAAQAQTRAGQAEAAAGAAQLTANAAQIAAANAESIVQNFVITPSNFTIEPNIYSVTYDPNDSSISPASLVFYSYVFVGGVKSPYTAAKLTAYAVHDGLTMPASQVDALDASSLTFPVPAYLDKDDYIVVKAYKSPEPYVYQEVAFLTVPVIAEGLNGEVQSEVIAPDFDTTYDYYVNTYVWYNGKLYKFNTDHAAGAWNSSDADEVCVAWEIENNYADFKQFTDAAIPYMVDNHNNKAPVIISSASGAIASFPDGADQLPVKSITCSIEPIQAGSGDPSPDNVRPISGRTGCTIVRGGTDYTKSGQTNGYRLDGNGGLTASVAYTTTDYIDVHEFGKVFFGSTWDSSAWIWRVARFDETKTFIDETDSDAITQGADITFDVGNAYYVRISVPYLDVTCYAYAGNSYQITFPSAAGTVYGGTLVLRMNESGVWTGELIVTMALVDMGDLTWAGYSSSLNRAFATMSDIKNTSGGSDLPNAKCSKLKLLTANAFDADTTIDYTFCVNNTNHIIWARIISATSANDYQTLLSGTQFAYELDQPIVYTLTTEQIGSVITTLYGDNNVWSDAGAVNLDYRADTKLYIERLTIPDDHDMIADTNIASGKFFMVGNDLYLSTAAIAAGAQITVGTNATRLSLADALNQINT